MLPPAEVSVRAYQPSDEESWLRCRVLSFLHTQFYDDVKTERTRFEGAALCLVAVLPGTAGGTVVGIIDIELAGVAATIDTIAVHPDHERRGVAGRLLEAALPQLISRGVTSLDAWTREDEPANQWYLGSGFRENFSYLHVHLEHTDGNDTGFRSPAGLGVPIKAFAHATLEHEVALRATFGRVYRCRQYLMTLLDDAAG
ncbi:GNAT family N-acetyltransferase [Nakamurella sp. A5-74]|uniref:GNAT family N-acetyltransferase n=1 Tax=Nakamurella sp. A5-74 TaxID=3158264 RepID=A0AAU8DP01_9ACTN